MLDNTTAAPDKESQKQKNDLIVKTDIMRYKKNNKAANFALLSLVFECLYFMVFYSLNSANFYTITIGISVVVNLCLLLLIMLAEEGVKNYNWKYSIMLLVIAAVQVIRIFYYPLKILGDEGYTTRYFFHNMGHVEFGIILIVFLVAAAACLVASAYFGYAKAKKLENFTKEIEEGKIPLDEALKEEPEEENVEVQNA